METPKVAAPKEILHEVSLEYEKTLEIPDSKQMPQWMLMPVGLVGAGKSTVVKPLSKKFNLIRVSTDEIRKILKERGYSYEGCREIASSLVLKYLRLGYSIAVDGNTGSVHGVEYNNKTKAEFPNVRMFFIHVNPPEEFIENKLRNYNHTWLFRDGDHAVESFRANKKGFMIPDIKFDYIFDTSRADLPQQIEECTEKIKEMLSK